MLCDGDGGGKEEDQQKLEINFILVGDFGGFEKFIFDH